MHRLSTFDSNKVYLKPSLSAAFVSLFVYPYDSLSSDYPVLLVILLSGLLYFSVCFCLLMDACCFLSPPVLISCLLCQLRRLILLPHELLLPFPADADDEQTSESDGDADDGTRCHSH